MVLRVVRYLCEQNERKGIHVLLAAGLPEILGVFSSKMRS